MRAMYGATATRSRVRTRVASSDWCASRNVVSVTARAVCARRASAKPRGPSSRSRWRDPAGAGCRRAPAGSLSTGRTTAVRGPFGWLTVTSASQLRIFVPRSFDTLLRTSPGRSSMKEVLMSPAWKSGSSSTPWRKGMFVETPRIRNSARARLARVTAAGKSRPRQVSFASIESKCGLICAPVATVPPSMRIPPPPGERYVVILPVSGRKPCAGSSVVMRHWSAAPRSTIASWRRPSSARVSPAAMRICDCTRSTSVTSSVTVCSTWMRGFISMKTCCPARGPSVSSRNSTVPALT